MLLRVAASHHTNFDGLSEPERRMKMSEAADLLSKLQQLQSRFTWDLKKEDLELDDLSGHLQLNIDQQQGQRGAQSHYYRFQAYVRYLQGRPEEALSILTHSERETRKCYGEESERRLIVTYGDMAWLKFHAGDNTEAQRYWQRVKDTLVKHPLGSSSDLHPEVYGEKAWTFLKFFYYDKAIECFRRALELQPDDWEWNNGYAIALYRKEESCPEALSEESPATKQLRRALETSPDDGVLLSMLALKLLYYHKHREADVLLEAARKVGSDDMCVITNISKYFRKQNRLDEAISVLETALRKKIQSASIHHQLALCYKKKKTDLLPKKPKPEREVQHWRSRSIQHLEEAVRRRNSFTSAKADLALQYAEEYQETRAQKMFEDVLEKVEEEPACIRQSIYRCYAEYCHYYSIQKDLAITYYTKAVEIGAQTRDGRYCAGKLRKMAERRLKNNPADAAALSILRAVDEAEGRQRQRALERDAANDEHLSDVCARLQLH